MRGPTEVAGYEKFQKFCFVDHLKRFPLREIKQEVENFTNIECQDFVFIEVDLHLIFSGKNVKVVKLVLED